MLMSMMAVTEQAVAIMFLMAVAAMMAVTAPRMQGGLGRGECLADGGRDDPLPREFEGCEHHGRPAWPA